MAQTRRKANEILLQFRKKNYENKLIREVKLEYGEVITNFATLNKEIDSFLWQTIYL